VVKVIYLITTFTNTKKILMSWSIIFIGTPDNISKALAKHSEQLTGKSKEEFDIALPHLAGLVGQNFNKTSEPVLKLMANGHAYDSNGVPEYSNCQVVIENLGAALV
jgi:hypothetical protein